MALVMEFCPGGCLEDHLRKHHDLGTMEALLYCFEIARGMRYLHYYACTHRDLATRNVLIAGRLDVARQYIRVCCLENGSLKIADFGLSEFANETSCLKSPNRLPIR